MRAALPSGSFSHPPHPNPHPFLQKDDVRHHQLQQIQHRTPTKRPERIYAPLSDLLEPFARFVTRLDTRPHAGH